MWSSWLSLGSPPFPDLAQLFEHGDGLALDSSAELPALPGAEELHEVLPLVLGFGFQLAVGRTRMCAGCSGDCTAGCNHSLQLSRHQEQLTSCGVPKILAQISSATQTRYRI